MKVLVLGAGNVGRAVALDMRDEFEVYVADASESALKRLSGIVETLKLDARDFNGLVSAMKGFDLVVGALPGKFGYDSIRAAIRAGVDMVDVSFTPRDPLELRDEAEKAEITVIFDAGFAPGLSHILMGRIWNELDTLEEGEIAVGGLPKDPRPPLYYRLTWSPEDLIAEYTRPARLIRNGKITSVEPLSEIRRMKILGFEFEAFPSDGLRSLLESIRAERLEEWTLRWPGHLERMRVLWELGFLNGEHLNCTLDTISPLMEYDSPDFSVLFVRGRGTLEGRPYEIGYTVYDEEREGLTSMARLTGSVAAITARIVAEKGCIFGVIPPEILGMRIDTFTRIEEELSERGVELRRWEGAPSDTGGGGA